MKNVVLNSIYGQNQEFPYPLGNHIKCYPLGFGKYFPSIRCTQGVKPYFLSFMHTGDFSRPINIPEMTILGNS